MRPVIALVGRPNVGKSTLFNRLTRSRDALVANIPGLTRDRKYGGGAIEGQSFIAIDTGGISGDEEGIDLEMASQSLQAIEEANICLFMVDAKDGLLPDDNRILDHLRKRSKNTYLVVNKIDGRDPDAALEKLLRDGGKNVGGAYNIAVENVSVNVQEAINNHNNKSADKWDVSPNQEICQFKPR
mgnify:CR=1 FL=1